MAQPREFSMCMLLEDVDGEAEEKIYGIRARKVVATFLRGDLVIREPEHKQPSSRDYVAVQSFNPRERFAVVPKRFLATLSERQFQLLSTVPSSSDRYAAYLNKHLNEAENYSVNSKVLVYVSNYPERTPGVVWYTGPVESISRGILFGVELLADPPRGNCNGTLNGKKYFTCFDKCGVFVSFDKMRLCATDEEFARRVAAFCTKSDRPTRRLTTLTQRESEQQHRVTRSKTAAGQKQSDACNEENKLQIGMEVVVFEDGEKVHKGHVRWLGTAYGTGKSKSMQPVAGLEMVSKHVNIQGLEGMECQKGAFFKTEHGGRKVYLPVSSLMPLTEYSKSIHNSADKGGPVNKQESNSVFQGVQNELRGDHGITVGTNGSSKGVVFEKETQSTNRTQGRSNAHVVKQQQEQLLQKVKEMRNLSQSDATGAPQDFYMNAAIDSSNEKRKNKELGSVVGDDCAPLTSDEVFTDPSLNIGSTVEVAVNDRSLHGVIQWFGWVNTGTKGKIKVVGIELDNPIEGGTDGTYLGQRCFKCEDGCGWFVLPQYCTRDSRFDTQQIGAQPGLPDMTASMRDRMSEAKGKDGGYGPYGGELVSGHVSYNKAVSDAVCGEFKGIQGHHNSCYLDATLFSMFYATHVFDTVFNRKEAPGQKQSVYDELRCILKDRIVNPLRKNHFVRADQVMKLRARLDKLGDIDGLTHEEKDPEEFLNTLLNQVFKEEHYLRLRSGKNEQGSYMYQLFMEKDDNLRVPTVQRLVEQSFVGSDVKLVEVPQVFILQMPRFGKKFKLYDRILPSPKLQIEDITMCCKRVCVMCEDFAEIECKQCQVHHPIETSCFCASLCYICSNQIHKHSKRKDHHPKRIKYTLPQSNLHHPEELELFAVVCIETSHYVSFVKFEDDQWVFFDSMADRKGGEDGYNIPRVTRLRDVPYWLNNPDKVLQADLRDIPDPIRRMFVDAYMCMYISPTESMY